jgi:hypothetical protein
MPPLRGLALPSTAAAAATVTIGAAAAAGGGGGIRAEEAGAGAKGRAEWEAWVQGRVGALQREGLWSGRRAGKVPEPPRGKTHWDYVLEEMAWMAHDFAEERRFKMALARRVSKEVLRYHQARRTREERESRKEEQRLRRQATAIAREVVAFWLSVEKLVRHKHQTRLEQRKREALDKHLDFLVGQTERYSTMLAEELATPSITLPSATTASTTHRDGGADGLASSSSSSIGAFCPPHRHRHPAHLTRDEWTHTHSEDGTSRVCRVCVSCVSRRPARSAAQTRAPDGVRKCLAPACRRECGCGRR